MNYEKKYNEALERAKVAIDIAADKDLVKGVATTIFPELRESEDERIRKHLVAIVEMYWGKTNDPDKAKELALLERQKDLFKSGAGLYCYDGENTVYVGWPATEENPYDFAMSQQEKQKECVADSSKTSVNEDERIRKALIEFCKAHDGIFPWATEFTFSDILSWLEKQKEPHYTKRNALFDKCVAECDPEIMQRVSDEIDEMLEKEPKPNIEICPHSIRSKSYKENGYPIENCDYGLEIAKNILEKTLGKVEGYQSDDGIREHQTAIKAVKDAMEEQKPAFTEDMPYITDEHFYEREPVDSFKYKLAEYMTRCCTKKEGPYGYEYGISAETILKMAEEELLKRGIVQKPAEWSEDWREEDIQTRFAFYTYKDDPSVLYLSNVFVEEASRNHGFGTRILKAAEKVAEAIGAITIRLKVKQDSSANVWYRKNGYGYMTFEDGYDWLEKNLEYMKPTEQEWSEEDERMLHRAITIIERNSICNQNMIDWLKSLRPQPHWKPSEEQMMALLSVLRVVKGSGDKIQDNLESLYNDLKKLI